MLFPDSIQKLFPKYQFEVKNGNVSIIEKDVQAKLKEIQFSHDEFWSIDTNMIKDFSSFFEKANSPDFFHKDCDGIFMFEYEGQKYILVVELKSSFDTNKIYYARTQIISSYIKLNILLNMIPEYEKDEYVFKGVIASLNPNDEQLNGISKTMMLPDNDLKKKQSSFALNLYRNKKRIITKGLCQEIAQYELSDKCMFEELAFNYIGIDAGNTSHSLTIAEFLS
ncbi:hypothetical protein FACS1894123_07090 [Bacteroidia bacterium]|nr:hypothetical protein FACS1894123_07090 [Bacteroidia bacterium]